MRPVIRESMARVVRARRDSPIHTHAKMCQVLHGHCRLMHGSGSRFYHSSFNVRPLHS